MIGKDPFGRHNNKDMRLICIHLYQTHSLKKLLLDEINLINFFQDEEIIKLSGAICRMPNLKMARLLLLQM